MVRSINTATVKLNGMNVGAVLWQESQGHAVFEFEPSFLKQGLDISPIHMGLNEALNGDAIFQFPALSSESFSGLPGLLADALPDKFGNALIDTWLTRQGRDISTFNPVERLCYIGSRAMGALEFHPIAESSLEQAVQVDIAELAGLAQTVTSKYDSLNTKFGDSDTENKDALLDIIRVGTSAGGARSKAIIAMNERGEICSGQAAVPKGFTYWLLKFDGVNDIELGASQQYGRIEYAYYLMAKSAGIDMSESKLFEEGGRAHFLTKRFDRLSGGKIHMQSLCGIAHYDFNMAGAYSYEDAFMIMRKLKLSKLDSVEQYRRMVFNVVARNQDDHTKNISFLMDSKGRWKLSPAYDVTYSHNPKGNWTNKHQMSIARLRDGFERKHLIEVGESISLKDADLIIDKVLDAVSRWDSFAKEAGLDSQTIRAIASAQRTL